PSRPSKWSTTATSTPRSTSWGVSSAPPTAALLHVANPIRYARCSVGAPFMTNDTALDELKASVALACRVLAHLGMVDYLGHVSARIASSDHFVMSPRGNALGNLLAFTAADMLVVDRDGQRVDGAH